MKRALVSILLVTAGLAAHAQTIRLKVQDEAGTPLEDAFVVNLRTATHAHSNEDGYTYLSNTVPGDTLSISHISYTSQNLIYSEQNLLVVKLVKSSLHLSEVVVHSNTNHLGIISAIDTRINPVGSSQELLKRVPGLFIGQHAGGGKAEQIFLRGFDIDHGTDINISVDGMPVNMVSHAHGQGYADLHFLIPETVDKIDFDKGPYHAHKGNLATAGYVAFSTKERLDHSSISLEAGRFNTLRTVAQISLVNQQRHSAYVAAEFLNTDGYFESPQNFYRLNVFGKYTGYVSEKDKLSFSFSHLASKWNASGQIPQRAVDSGFIDRFGSIDPTEGGNTSRTNLILKHTRYLDNNSSIRNHVYYTRYGFDLFSNFTFYLNDSVHGDQIRQRENRDMVGFESVFSRQYHLREASVNWQTGVGLRYDMVNNIGLLHTANRKTVIDSVQFGEIHEANLYAYTGAEIKWGKWLINPALRIDAFTFDYIDQLAPAFSNPAAKRSIVSPKLNVVYTANNNLQYFFKLGKGFHSNDTRTIVTESVNKTLPAAYGADLGLTWKPYKNLIINSALWYLYLQQEFVYVGDAGVVEPGGKTERTGIDLGLRWQIGKSVFVTSDFTYTLAKALDEAKDNDYLPLAPKVTFTGGINFQSPSGFGGSFKTRYLGNRPANEDNSIVARGYTVSDLNVNYSLGRFTLGIITENIFNVDWNETQFATESRLYNEPQSVTEIHFTPGTPFNIRGMVKMAF